eukprot:1157450-Pelagomonas_calceolata.AAC.4
MITNVKLSALHALQLPSPVVVNAGGFGYASTDMAALKHRLEVEKADWIIYVTDAGYVAVSVKHWVFLPLASIQGHSRGHSTTWPLASIQCPHGVPRSLILLGTKSSAYLLLCCLLSSALRSDDEVAKHRIYPTGQQNAAKPASQAVPVIGCPGLWINLPLLVPLHVSSQHYHPFLLLSRRSGPRFSPSTNCRQAQHFDLVFSAAKKAGWIGTPESKAKIDHVGFGLVLGEDGKKFKRNTEGFTELATECLLLPKLDSYRTALWSSACGVLQLLQGGSTLSASSYSTVGMCLPLRAHRTRSGDVVRLVELLDEAKARCTATIRARSEETGETVRNGERLCLFVSVYLCGIEITVATTGNFCV